MALSTTKDKRLRAIDYRIGSKIQHYSGKIGTIAGIKILNNYMSIYLIEFMDHNRIWVTKKEVICQD